MRLWFDIHSVAKYRNKWKGTLWFNPKNFKKSRIVPKNTYIANRGSLVCFRVSGRRSCFFLFWPGSEVSSVLNLSSSSCWTNEQKSGPYAPKKTTHCKSRAHSLLKCADWKRKGLEPNPRPPDWNSKHLTTGPREPNSSMFCCFFMQRVLFAGDLWHYSLSSSSDVEQSWVDVHKRVLYTFVLPSNPHAKSAMILLSLVIPGTPTTPSHPPHKL